MATNSETFHVVCRDCRSEELVASAEAAEAQATEHAESTDHAVAFGRIV